MQGGITISGELGWADLVTNTSFAGRHLDSQFDASSAWPQLTGYPIGPSPFDYTRSIQSFTHETRLVSTSSGSRQWLAGLFLAHHDEDFTSRLSGPNGFGQAITARAENLEERGNDAALFGEATYAFSSDWSLTAGARWFDATKKVSDHAAGILFQPPTAFSGTSSQGGTAPKIVLEYHPNDDVTFYALGAEGYRLGGINVDGPKGATGEADAKFDSDELIDYEIGTKLHSFGGLAAFDATAYYVTWRNVQTDQISPEGAFYVLNVGSVRDAGLEFDGIAHPLENLTVQANFLWNDTTLMHVPTGLANGEAVLPGAPDVTAAVSARYAYDLAQWLHGFASVDYSYVGVSHLGYGETTPSMGGYRLLNLRLGIDCAPWQFTFFADNLTDDRGNTFAFGNPFDLGRQAQITPPRPRTLGISLTWSR